MNVIMSVNRTRNLKVLVSTADFPEIGLRILREHFTVVQNPYSDYGAEGIDQIKKELMKLIPGSSALVWMSPNPIWTELLVAAGPRLKMVATCAASYENCNLDELKIRGIKLSNAPNVVSSIVAEIAVALILEAAKRFMEYVKPYRRVEWEMKPVEDPGQDIKGSTIGVVGFGSIGQATVKKLSGFGVGKFLYTGHREKPEARALNAEFTSLDYLLRRSDFIVFSVPLTDETLNMINNDNIKKMKKTAILIILGHGSLVDTDALYEAMKNKKIFAVGLDLYTLESLPNDHNLLDFPNLIFFPHKGASTVRVHNDAAVLAANNVVNGLTGKPLITPVLP